jgi:hypothetical protein
MEAAQPLHFDLRFSTPAARRWWPDTRKGQFKFALAPNQLPTISATVCTKFPHSITAVGPSRVVALKVRPRRIRKKKSPTTTHACFMEHQQHSHSSRAPCSSRACVRTQARAIPTTTGDGGQLWWPVRSMDRQFIVILRNQLRKNDARSTLLFIHGTRMLVHQ